MDSRELTRLVQTSTASMPLHDFNPEELQSQLDWTTRLFFDNICESKARLDAMFADASASKQPPSTILGRIAKSLGKCL